MQNPRSVPVCPRKRTAQDSAAAPAAPIVPTSKYTFYYTNLAFDLHKLRYKADLIIDASDRTYKCEPIETDSTFLIAGGCTLNKTPIQILISNSWEYKFMFRSETPAHLESITDWNRAILINFTTAELKDYMHLVKHVVGSFIDERNMELVGMASHRSLELVSADISYQRHFIEKFFCAYNLYLNEDTFNTDNTIYTREESIERYTNGKLFENKYFELDVMKNALQIVYRQQNRLIYYSSTRKLDRILDTLLQEQYRLNVLFNFIIESPSTVAASNYPIEGGGAGSSNTAVAGTVGPVGIGNRVLSNPQTAAKKIFSRIHVPNVFTPNLHINKNKYIKWELYRINRLKSTKNWVPFFNTQNILTHRYKHFIGTYQHSYIPLSYNSLSSIYDFLIL